MVVRTQGAAARPAPSPLPPVSLLVVEDDPADARLVRLALRAYAGRCTVSHCTTLEAAIGHVAGQPCDIALLDLSLPDSAGFDTIRKMRAAAPDLPLIVLTGFDDEDFAMQAMAAGTQDYLVKGQAEGPLMWRAIQNALARHRLEEELRLSEQRLTGIVALAQDAILLIDGEHRITLFNPAAEQTFGFRADEIAGQPLSLLFPEKDPIPEPDGSGALATGRAEISGIRRDGTEFPAEISVARMATSSGTMFTVVIRDITERKGHEDELRRLATTDPLTGLANRRHFMACAEVEMVRAQRYRRPLSILMMDVDHFKRINDGFGHDGGDLALVRLAETCRGALRDSDLLGRLGGEEFAALLPETGADAAADIAERLRAAVSGLLLDTARGPLRLTVSLGVATAEVGEASIDPALRRADTALYSAKARGRNRVVLVSDAAPSVQCTG